MLRAPTKYLNTKQCANVGGVTGGVNAVFQAVTKGGSRGAL